MNIDWTGALTRARAHSPFLATLLDRQPELEARLAAVPGLDVQAAMERLTTGIRLAFSNAITAMFTTSLWIILLGLIITLFIPVIPLHTPSHKASTAEKPAD